VIQWIKRRHYYCVLNQADAGKPAQLVNFIGRVVERSLNLYLEVRTPASAPPAPEVKWILLGEAAEGMPYSQEYLSRLARTGRLEALKSGRRWHTTRNAVEEYCKPVEQGRS